MRLIAWTPAITLILLFVGAWVALWLQRRREDEAAENDRVIEGIALLAGQPIRPAAPEPYIGAHRVGVAAGTEAQRLHWNRPTGAFEVIVSQSYTTAEHENLAEMIASWKCQSCEVGEHHDCPGCTCPCALEVAV